jgi:hypothetical protein
MVYVAAHILHHPAWQPLGNALSTSPKYTKIKQLLIKMDIQFIEEDQMVILLKRVQ